MPELLVDFITSLDGYASGEGWPGFWGLQGPEYLAWLEEQPEVTYVMGANTYRLMSGFAAGETPAGTDEFTTDEEASVDELTRASKVVFSSSLEEPLAWANSTLVRDDAVEAVRAMKEAGPGLLSTIGSLSLCRSLLRGRTRRSLPGGDVPGDHRRHRGRTHLRRLPRRRPRDDRPAAPSTAASSWSSTGPACSSAHRSTPPHDVTTLTAASKAGPTIPVSG